MFGIGLLHGAAGTGHFLGVLPLLHCRGVIGGVFDHLFLLGHFCDDLFWLVDVEICCAISANRCVDASACGVLNCGWHLLAGAALTGVFWKQAALLEAGLWLDLVMPLVQESRPPEWWPVVHPIPRSHKFKSPGLHAVVLDPE